MLPFVAFRLLALLLLLCLLLVRLRHRAWMGEESGHELDGPGVLCVSQRMPPALSVGRGWVEAGDEIAELTVLVLGVDGAGK